MFCERENRILLSTQVIVPSISHWTDALSGLCHWRSFSLPPPSSSWFSYSDAHFTEAESLTKVTEGPVRWTLTVSS